MCAAVRWQNTDVHLPYSALFHMQGTHFFCNVLFFGTDYFPNNNNNISSRHMLLRLVCSESKCLTRIQIILNEAASVHRDAAKQLSDEVPGRSFTFVTLADREAVTVRALRGSDETLFNSGWHFNTLAGLSRCTAIASSFLSSIFRGWPARRSGI